MTAIEERGTDRVGWGEVLLVTLFLIALEALLQFILFLSLQGPSLEAGPEIEVIFAGRMESRR